MSIETISYWCRWCQSSPGSSRAYTPCRSRTSARRGPLAIRPGSQQLSFKHEPKAAHGLAAARAPTAGFDPSPTDPTTRRRRPRARRRRAAVSG
jgi:hypothetical protein